MSILDPQLAILDLDPVQWRRFNDLFAEGWPQERLLTVLHRSGSVYRVFDSETGDLDHWPAPLRGPIPDSYDLSRHLAQMLLRSCPEYQRIQLIDRGALRDVVAQTHTLPFEDQSWDVIQRRIWMLYSTTPGIVVEPMPPIWGKVPYADLLRGIELLPADDCTLALLIFDQGFLYTNVVCRMHARRLRLISSLEALAASPYDVSAHTLRRHEVEWMVAPLEACFGGPVIGLSLELTQVRAWLNADEKPHPWLARFATNAFGTLPDLSNESRLR